ncbi:hypothetical protein HG535_0D04080 [Zygotorulaspora mrakii]|uniref:Uncharacterized protein n=1 Tax=Zygotorulaspora mrakii TaxID=42260 RepID=A0A7H9B261_ZYGMR|nr:uncharacterized protein HG535_0D04080 [Zygotorulaspora mrakii]QLG72700.1 hypothetical protein HG535_0D04080 [Zygotorulaspora mrakii]
MDGLLLNTEDIYTLSLNEILATYGKGPLTWDVKIHLQGLPGEEAGQKVIDTYDLPISYEEYNRLNHDIQARMWGQCKFLPGAVELIKYLNSEKIPIALCTSSAKIKYQLKTKHLQENFQLFDTIVTGDDPRIPKGRGKPFPNIWQLGLKELIEKFGTAIEPQECLVFEDGIPGVKSGLAFGANVIWVPHPGAYEYLGDTKMLLGNNGELLKSLELLNKSKYGL